MKTYMNSPKTLTFCGRAINKADAGNAPGSTAYVNHTTGLMVDLFQGQVFQISRHFDLAAVVGNEALAKVRVINGENHDGEVFKFFCRAN